MSVDEIVIEIDGRAITAAEAGKIAHDLASAYASSRDESLRRGIRLGEYLLGVKRQLEHGAFLGWLSRYGINRHTARRAMRLAEAVGDGRGGLDHDKVAAKRDELKIPPGHPLAEMEIADMSRRQVEQAVGLRPFAATDIRPPAGVVPADRMFGPNADHGQHLEEENRENEMESPNVDHGQHLRHGISTPVVGVSGRQLELIDYVAGLVDEAAAELEDMYKGGVDADAVESLAERLRRALEIVEQMRR